MSSANSGNTWGTWGGYQCALCQQWVPWNTTHMCPGYAPTITYSDPRVAHSLERVEQLLGGILACLAKLEHEIVQRNDEPTDG